MDDCIFCKIAAGEIPAKIVVENEHAVAFEDVNPQAPTHVLVIPRTHVADVLEADEALIGRLMQTACEVAKKTGLDKSGFRVVTNTGATAGQSVFHLHIHVLGGRTMGWPPG
jgi:histidine triad (HIT) family protein